MIHIRQPTARTCGQAVLAMLLGLDVAEVIADMGKAGTHARQLIDYATARGCSFPHRGARWSSVLGVAQLGSTSILRIIWGGKRHRTHWSLWAEDGVWDPAFDHAALLPKHPDALSRPSLRHPGEYEKLEGRVMSYLRLQKRS